MRQKKAAAIVNACDIDLSVPKSIADCRPIELKVWCKVTSLFVTVRCRPNLRMVEKGVRTKGRCFRQPSDRQLTGIKEQIPRMLCTEAGIVFRKKQCFLVDASGDKERALFRCRDGRKPENQVHVLEEMDRLSISSESNLQVPNISMTPHASKNALAKDLFRDIMCCMLVHHGSLACGVRHPSWVKTSTFYEVPAAAGFILREIPSSLSCMSQKMLMA